MQGGYGTGDLLTLLLEAKHEDGRPAFSKQEVHDEVRRCILPRAARFRSAHNKHISDRPSGAACIGGRHRASLHPSVRFLLFDMGYACGCRC